MKILEELELLKSDLILDEVILSRYKYLEKKLLNFVCSQLSSRREWLTIWLQFDKT